MISILATDIQKEIEDINKQSRNYEVVTYFSQYEKEYLETLACILYSIGNHKVLKKNTLPELIRFALSFMGNIYEMNFFPDSRLISRLNGKKAKKEFIAFRAKYMNVPVDAQLQELKRLGLVGQSKQK